MQTIEVIPARTPVYVKGHNQDRAPHLPGKVIAHTVAEGSLYYIVDLERGFYSEDRMNFIKMIVAHSDNVEEAAQ